jgi:O6-methylguanine-DNA--protein-cysteine methyltransferase
MAKANSPKPISTGCNYMSFVERLLDLGAIVLRVWVKNRRVKGCRIVEKRTEKSVFRLVPLEDLEPDLSGFSDFEKRVLSHLRAVPPGRVTTYGNMAATLGSPGAARTVGGVMAKNPFPIMLG